MLPCENLGYSGKGVIWHVSMHDLPSRVMIILRMEKAPQTSEMVVSWLEKGILSRR